MFSSAEIATIRAEIERLEKALDDCADSGLRKWIEGAIEKQKRSWHHLKHGQKSVHRTRNRSNGHFPLESPNARPEKDQSQKSERVPGHALPTLLRPDSTGRTAPINQANRDTAPLTERGTEWNQTLFLPPAIRSLKCSGRTFQIRLAEFNSCVTNLISR
jgi:hypothetical protein